MEESRGNTVRHLIGGAFERQPHAVARLLSALDAPIFDDLAWITTRCYERSGYAHVVGITGPPGVGKSTLLNGLIRAWRRSGKTVAVLAVDPSSVISGGALLGDRIRMHEHWQDDGVFIRSLATRGAMGGLTGSVVRSVELLDAARYDIVCIETVGVGQAELDVMAVTDTTVLVLPAGVGDGIQAAKGGILEVADILCVNRADNPEAAKRTLRHIREARTGAARPFSVVETVATTGLGVAELAATVQDHLSARDSDIVLERRKARTRRLLLEIAEEYIEAYRPTFSTEQIDELSHQVAQKRLDPINAVKQLLNLTE